ncbi:GntR family transcriptional regulator [Fusibacter sp. 3D3]|uniref:GntR family transcriptional regulator n=1 Tax=Fusibacter sp. 3D3 TaxID=1048380 RepID=UPI0008533891|nr:GntR family transcriptional regulator [Fusibacter sp. 3D3]GAU79780.1 transcriptional regulator [Fusibacter sp. 3D3]
MSLAINKMTLSEQIYHVLREDILNQEIRCGEKLTLQSLKERFQVSHTPIREALTRLAEDNLITYYSNVGVTVVTLNDQDIREIFEFNGDLDCLALQYAMHNAHKTEFLAELDEIVKTSSAHLEKNDLLQWSEFSDAFHLVFYKYANNSRLEIAAKKLRAQTTLLYNLYHFESQNAKLIQEDHIRINEALQKSQIEKAKTFFKEHLNRDMMLALSTSDKIRY